MKTGLILFLAAVLPILLGREAVGKNSQEKPQDKVLQEFVRVVNVEMVVRVMQKGRAVGGLKKTDFTILEDGEPRPVNGFFEMRRRIARSSGIENYGKTAVPERGRLFLLFFWINEPQVDAMEAIDYFFREIYRPSDRVILATQSDSLEIGDEAEKEDVLNRFRKLLVEQGEKGRLSREALRRELNAVFREYWITLETYYRMDPEIRPPQMLPQARLMMATSYAHILTEYRINSLTPHLQRIESLARSLERVEAEKWALVFYQRERMPLFDLDELGRRIELEIDDGTIRKMETAQKEITTPFGVSSFDDVVRSRFIQANTLFYLMMLDSRLPQEVRDADLPMPVISRKDLYSNWEKVYRDITKITGGKVLDANRMKEALAEAAEIEDIYYILTYSPREGGPRKRRLDVRVNRSGTDVIFGRRLEMEKLPEIKLKNAAWNQGMLNLYLEGLYRLQMGTNSGRVSVIVTGILPGETEEKTFFQQVVETLGEVELPLALEGKGEMTLHVHVRDLLTGHETAGDLNVEIDGIYPSRGDASDNAEMMKTLERAGEYCDLLKRKAFHFICREEVTEDILKRNVQDFRPSANYDRNTWLYDYQIVLQDGKIGENRILLRKNRKNLHRENVKLENRFRSLYSFYLPVTLLAREKRELYRYSFMGRERMKKRPVMQVAVDPLDEKGNLAHGEVWIDTESGAVLKISLNQRSIKGVKEMEKKAAEQGAELNITDNHYYFEEREGVRFPTATEIFERYVSRFKPAQTGPVNSYSSAPTYSVSVGHAEFELSRTYIKYSDYRFFDVSVQVKREMEKGE